MNLMNRKRTEERATGKMSNTMEPQSSGIHQPQPELDGVHLLVVIDHREARIYKTELKASVPERITPFDPHGYGRYLHSVTDDSNGQRKRSAKVSTRRSQKVCKAQDRLCSSAPRLAASSAMEQLIANLNHHHADVAKRIVGSVAVDEHHLTEGQLLARAREFYASALKPLKR